MRGALIRLGLWSLSLALVMPLVAVPSASGCFIPSPTDGVLGLVDVETEAVELRGYSYCGWHSVSARVGCTTAEVGIDNGLRPNPFDVDPCA